METYIGIVNGIDAQETPGVAPRCQAFINISETDYIQVTTSSQNLQSALELACLLRTKVEATYDDSNTLMRVRILDRG